MSVTQVDSSWEHLLPEFASKLRKVLDETKSATGFHWVMTEGYRSVARQEWLYQQGRSRPGQIVTWMRTPKKPRCRDRRRLLPDPQREDARLQDRPTGLRAVSRHLPPARAIESGLGEE